MKIIYENAAEEIALEEAIKFYENGIAVVINDGKDVTFGIETVSTSEEKKADQSQQL